MRLIRDAHGISRLFLIVLLLVAFVLGATLSYVWTMSYYAPKEFQLPTNSAVTLENVQFSPQDTSHFNVTILNPSFSPSIVIVSRIAVLTADEVVHDPSEVSPPLPRSLLLGESITFECDWDWRQYTEQGISVLAWLEDGSGATLKVNTPLVSLVISDLEFNSSVSVNRFNVTVRNLEPSVTHVNVTSISLDSVQISSDMVVQGLPYAIARGESAKFTCLFNWTDYQGRNVAINVGTLQGYSASVERFALPKPVTLEITDILFDPSNTSRFSVTVSNNIASPGFVSVNEVFLTMENGTAVKILEVSPPHVLQPNASALFVGFWNWTHYRNQTLRVTVHTLQGFVVSSAPKITPPPIVLEIIAVDFNPVNTTRFNVTVLNSPFSLGTANITEITVTLEGGTVVEISSVEPSLPLELAQNESAVFTCVFEWFNYPDMEVTVTAYTSDGFKATFSVKIPTPE